MKLSSQISEDIEYAGVMNYLLIASILVIAIDNLPYFSGVLGELGFKASAYPFIVLAPIVGISIIKKKEIYFNKSIENKILLIFSFWIILSSIVNLNGILMNEFKSRSGLNKLILQLMVFCFMLVIYYCVDFVRAANKITLEKLRKYIVLSTIPVGIYGAIELLNIWGLFEVDSILKSLSYIFQTYGRGEVYGRGVRTITGEPSYFGMYLAFLLPWVLSYIFTEKERKKQILFGSLSIYLLILLVMSKSRTSYAILFLEIFLFTIFILINNFDKKIKIKLISLIAILGVGLVVFSNSGVYKKNGDMNNMSNVSIKGLIQSLTDRNNMSNRARVGFQKAAVRIGNDNILLGVGTGQYGFYAKDYVDELAKESEEVQNWIDEENTSWPPTFALYPRIYAENGLVGLTLFVGLIMLIIVRAFIVVRKRKNDFLGVALIVSFLGTSIAWLNADSYAQIGFWIILPFIIKYNSGEVIDKE